MDSDLSAKSYSETTPDILSSYEAYGCKVNSISPEELFRRYESAGFLYPTKLDQLAPFLPVVKENWRKAMRGGELILYVITHENPIDGDWASVSSWRHTNGGFQSQHLVSIGSPVSSRAVMLGTQAMRIQNGCRDDSYQNWYRPENRFPARVFGTLMETVGAEYSAVASLNLLSCPLNGGKVIERVKVSSTVQNGSRSGLKQLAEVTRGPVYAKAEELDQDDMGLEAADELYIRVGLRRYRRIWLAMLPGYDLPVGAAIAYRGPLGLNFNFLENRCDLLISPAINDQDAGEVALSLLAAADQAYADFLPGAIPVVADDRTATALQNSGARFVRKYCQSIWMRPGFLAWYRHVEKFYERITRANKRHGLGAKHIQLSDSAKTS